MIEKKERFEILLEDLKKNFKAAFEGITTLRNEMRGGFETVNEKIEKLDQKLDAHMRQPAHAQGRGSWFADRFTKDDSRNTKKNEKKGVER